MERELPEARDTPSTQVERLEENQVTTVPPLSVQATKDYETMERERPEVTDTPSTQFEDYETMECELPEVTDTPSTQVERLEENQVTNVTPQSDQASKGRGKRIKKPSVLLQDFVLLTPGVTVKKVTRKKVTRKKVTRK
ncbi:uncharacterized protein LOC110227058 [Arabidopsis lyrata subsp. lyrata]|uniref:uncharacterized protein LOC110227058 n=1 Tax=Arabidopsis lyrata subsp. lyrata TaxID=81972 RepID=UPI000A29E886|nr:uncharacterized protein LOC110227058 [Arabidopsis lyrata subsp. lyrata]|eukprot:XP_020875812.1 uncharacterized protein LOC110227058 [Arabidopsis lyrata subsp. lyrata]